jgi:ADP-ribose pyrophosphatase YjhB (NUDIX family)
MNVKVRAVLIEDGQLVVTEERRPLRRHYALPGGRVSRWETAEEALVREVAEETGLTVDVDRLLYIAEATRPFKAHDLILVFLVEARERGSRVPLTISLDGTHEQPLLPPLLNLIAEDAAAGWPDNPRWLNNVWEPLSGR